MTLALFSLSISAFAGVAPAAAEKGFSARFPNAQKVKWGKEGANKFEAEFVLNGVRMSASFNQDGKWLETETSINIKDLPKAVSDFVVKNYPKAKINEAAKIERPNADVIYYEAEIKENGKEKDLLLTAEGKPVK